MGCAILYTLRDLTHAKKGLIAELGVIAAIGRSTKDFRL